MIFGGLETGWAYAPMPPAASAAVPRAALHSSLRRVTTDWGRIAESFVPRRLPPFQLNLCDGKVPLFGRLATSRFRDDPDDDQLPTENLGFGSYCFGPLADISYC